MLPSDPDLFSIDGDSPVFLACRCDSCALNFFPRRWVCAACCSTVRDIEVTGAGKLHTYALITTPSFGELRTAAAAYGVGQVDISGIRIQTKLGGDPDRWKIGQPFVAVLEVVDQKTTDSEATAVYRFDPAS